MTQTLRAAVAALALLAGVAAADDAADIRATIQSQLDAFRADDWDTAFEHASPGIQSMFRTPGAFSRMVRGGYPMVWRPSRVEVGPLEQGPGGPVQVMRFRDSEGGEWVAHYDMTQVDGRWRIDGVRIARIPDAAV